MNTKQVHISELSGAELDWAVAYVEGHTADPYTWLYEATVEDVADSNGFRPSSDWSQGGPRIEREKIAVRFDQENFHHFSTPTDTWLANYDGVGEWLGPTPLIAAMRCLVASMLGQDTITLITSE